jgi:hypothetical protein
MRVWLCIDAPREEVDVGRLVGDLVGFARKLPPHWRIQIRVEV